LDLLVRFQQIRQAARCFDYMIQNCVNWGDEGEIRRRTLLVRKLSYSQRNEFNDVFNIVDVEHRGIISLLEMKKFRTSAREAKTDSELSEIISRANPSMEGGTFITRDEFMGVMAEAEFYNLFRETFQELDQENTGFVRAGDLDSVLGGVRDLIGDKRHTNIIDVDDKDMLVDYEQFSKMLLGAGL
jgi:calmodulin